jgi:Tfp pilus assembly protein PilO
MVMALAWTLLISPRLAAVAQTRDQTVELQDQATLIRIQAQQLQRQAEDLPAQIRALRRIQSKIPSTVNVSALLREIQRLGRINNVTIDSLAPGEITVFSVQAPSTEAPSSDANSEQASPEAAAPAPQPAPTDLGQGRLPQGVGLSYVPVTVTATGEFSDLVNFTAQLESVQRAYLITGVQLSRASSSTEGKANPLTLVLETRVFVANDRLRSLPDEALEKAGAG